MRSTCKMFLTALAAVLSIAAVAAASASALRPEFAFTSFPVSYTGSTGAVTFLTKSGKEVHCTASQDRGEIASKKEFSNVTLTLTGCETVVSGFKFACTSKGAASGEVVTNKLTATLVYTNKTEKEVGLVFKPKTEGGAVAEYKCVALGSVTLTGAVVAKLPNEQRNKLTLSLTWNFRQKGGVQEPTEYFEESGTKVSGFLTSFGSQTGDETTETMSFSSALEVSS